VREPARVRSVPHVRTVGVDLAAQPEGTAVAVVEWTPTGARLCGVVSPAPDVDVIEAVQAAAKVGVDCPFGWPDAFVQAVGAHRAGTLAAPPSSGRPWRRELTLRETDRFVHARTGLTPLSVSADRIAHAALRWAAVSAALAELGCDVRRDGSGPLVEVYPAAALKGWGLAFRGYKGRAGAESREDLVAALGVAAPWLDLGEHAGACAASDHVLDAVICALVARAAALGSTEPPNDPGTAASEGWIHLPTGPLSSLPQDLDEPRAGSAGAEGEESVAWVER
jgi:predicted nuclease with RNAse H fold